MPPPDTPLLSSIALKWGRSSCFALFLLFPAALQAETSITEDFTQDGGTFEVDGALTIGGSGSPRLTLTNGAVSTGAEVLAIGYTQNGPGSLDILNGSVLTLDGTASKQVLPKLYDGIAYIGWAEGSPGSVLVSGSGSEWKAAVGVNVGGPAEGTVRIEAGGKATSGDLSVGFSTGTLGTVTVTGTGSQWVVEDTITLGNVLGTGLFEAKGQLNIEDGGVVTADLVQIGGHAENRLSFDNGTLHTGTLLAAEAFITGDGTIYTRGLMSDLDMSFSSAADFQQEFHLDGDGRDVTIHFTLDATRELGVGVLDKHSLTISGGVEMAVASLVLGYFDGGEGNALVTGAGTTLQSGGITVGRQGKGTMRVEKAASIVSTSLRLANGTLTLNGAGTTWENSGTSAIYSAEGSHLVIEDGASYTGTGEALLGRFSESVVTIRVTGEDSRFAITGDVSLHTGIELDLEIEEGGRADIQGNLLIGAGRMATAGVSVGDAGSRLAVSGNVILGGSSLTTATTGVGAMSINSGATAEIDGTLRIHTNGSVTLNGGTLEVRDLTPTKAEGFLFQKGILKVNGTLTGDLSVPEMGEFTGNATVTGNLLNAGRVAPGNSPGVLTVNGNYTQSEDGTLVMEIGHLMNDLLVVLGDLTVAGTLQLSGWQEYAPGAGDLFQLFSFEEGRSFGQFSMIETFDLAPGLYWDLSELYSTGQVMVIPEPSLGGMLLLVGGGAWLWHRRRRG